MAHRGIPADPPYRLALERDTGVIESWWPGGDARARAYAALLVSFDAPLVGSTERSSTPSPVSRGTADRAERRQKDLRSRSFSGRPSGSTMSR